MGFGLWMAAVGCAPARSPTTSLKLSGPVRDALVTIDDQPLGSLAFVARRGVALKNGRHRITITRDGYLPWDRWVEAAGPQPLPLAVSMTRIPD